MPRKISPTTRARQQKLAREQWQKIKPFVSFKINSKKTIVKKDRERIKTYFTEINRLQARPYQVWRGKSRKNLLAVQHFAQHEKYLPGLKVAFVPTGGEENLTIKISKSGKVTARTKHILTTGLEFDKKHLIADPDKEVARVIKNDSSDLYAIRAGKYEIPRTFSRERITDGVKRFMSRYNERRKNNYFGNWLHGLNGYTFDNQDTERGYMQDKLQAKRKLKRARRNAKKAKKRKAR